MICFKLQELWSLVVIGVITGEMAPPWLTPLYIIVWALAGGQQGRCGVAPTNGIALCNIKVSACTH